MCESSTMYLMSQKCLEWMENEMPVNETLDCFPNYSKWNVILSGILSLSNAIIGFTGNLLTLLAIPFAAKRKKFHLHNQWPTTFFILNLAFSDLLYCTFSLTMYAYEYFQMKWDLGLLFCKLLATFRYTISYSCWISVAMIAVTRCISITKPGQPTVFSHKKYRRFICALIWLFAIAIVLPTYFEVLGAFGFNCHFGHCYMIPNEDEDVSWDVILDIFSFSVPMIIIITSYTYIWIYMRRTNIYLISHGTSSTKEILMQRESRTTMALFFICLSYLIFVGPVTISDVIHDLKLYDDESTLHSDLHLVIINIYWLQFSCNFFIYAARSEQFRMAYLYFLKNVKNTIIEYSSNSRKSSTNMIYFIDQESTSIIRK